LFLLSKGLFCVGALTSNHFFLAAFLRIHIAPPKGKYPSAFSGSVGMQAWDLMRMWDSLVLEESHEQQQEWGIHHEGAVSEEHSKGLL